MRAAGVLVAVAFLSACGASSGDPAAEPEPAQPATVRFEHSVSREGPVYVEGAIYHVTVEQDGETLEDREIAHDGKLTLELVPGGYELGSYAEVCNGNCGSLSEPGDHCATDVDVADGGSVTATVVARPGGCEITIG